MRILAHGLTDTATTFLRQAGIEVEVQTVYSPLYLSGLLASGQYSAAVFALGTMELDALTPETIRSMRIVTPLIGVSEAQGEAWSEQRALFLERGGNDLLRHPVNPRELVASLGCISRWYKQEVSRCISVVELRRGNAVLKVNLADNTATVNDVELDLTSSPKALLILLAQRHGSFVAREWLCDSMYDHVLGDARPTSRMIDVFIHKIRKSLVAAHPDALFIETGRGGYKLTEAARQPKKPRAAAK